MKKIVNRIGPFVVVGGEVDGAMLFWEERGGKRVSGYSAVDDAQEYASLHDDEYIDDADVGTGE